VELALHDSAAALSELATAVQLEGRDPVLRLYYGAVLQGALRLAEAEEQWHRAIELDPYYAAPYSWLALNFRLRHDSAAAIEQYRHFIAHTALEDPHRAQALRDLAALSSVKPDSR
jgi:Flp pilus assembly protein TadD